MRAAVAALVPDAGRTMLEFPGGLELPNVCGFYDDFLTRTPLPTQDYHYVSFVHGDLNAANILVDAHDNVWVIDFFHAGRGHVLKDLAKFENDLLYLLTPIDDDAQLREAISITLALRQVADLRAPLADLPEDVRSPHLVRAWEILRVLRSLVGQVCHDDRNPLQLQVAGLRYAVHTLGFPEPSCAAEAIGPRRRVLARRPDREHRGGQPRAAGRLGRIAEHRDRPPRDDDLSWAAGP